MNPRLNRTMRDRRVITALVATVGICLAFGVMQWPTFTTLRIAGKALRSPDKATWWGVFKEPTRAQIKKAMKRDPSDWRMQLLYAKRLFAGVSEKEEAREGEADPARMREYKELLARNPRIPAVRAAYAGWLVTRNWDFLHPIDAEYYAELAAQAPAMRIEKAHPARRMYLVSATERQLGGLARLEPDNAAWPYLSAKCSFARLDDRQGIERLREAARGDRFSLLERGQIGAFAEAYSTLGVPGPEARLWVRSQEGVPPELSGTIWEAKIAVGLAEKMEARGDLKGATQTRMAVIDVGRTMWQTADDTITGLIGVAIEAIGYATKQVKPEVASRGSDEERLAARREYYLRLERAFVGLLDEAGIGDLAPRYAHGLENVLAYSEAMHRYVRDLDAQPTTRAYGSLGMGYSAAPASWLVFGVSVAAVIVAVPLALVRRKSARPSARTVLGVSIVGGGVCLGLLFVSGILAAKSPYGYGWIGAGEEVYRDVYDWLSSDSVSVEAAKHGHGFPATTVLYGLGVVALLTGSALVLILKPQLPHIWRVVFSAASPIALGAFWGYAWLTWVSESSKIGAWGIALHVFLGVVSVAAIAGVWWAWARGVRKGARTWLAAVAAFLVFVSFSTLFIPLSCVTGVPRWVFALAVPVSVALAAVVPRLVAVARLPAGERPSYPGILRPALATCLVWILVLQFASLVWLGAWRAKAAAEIERAFALSENQAVLRIMHESGGVKGSQ